MQVDVLIEFQAILKSHASTPNYKPGYLKDKR